MLSDFSKSIAPLIYERFMQHVEEVYESARKRDGYKCVVCGDESKEGEKLYPRFVVSQNKGGKVEVDNLKTLCVKCALKEVELEKKKS